MSKTVASLIQLQRLDNDVAGGKVQATPYRRRKRRELMRRIPADMARDYNRLRGRHADAVVPVIEGTCQGCYVQLAAAIRARLQNPRERVCCDHCGRILYLVSH